MGLVGKTASFLSRRSFRRRTPRTDPAIQGRAGRRAHRRPARPM